LQVSLYSSESFYYNGDDKVDPKIVTEFRNFTAKRNVCAEAKLKQEPKNIEALDVLANTEGLKAAFEEAVERRHFAALRDGNGRRRTSSRSVEARSEVHRCAANDWLYEYVVGALPLPVKIHAGATGYRGSKKRGLALLEQVAKEGRWSQDDAKTVLILLYTREKRYADVLQFNARAEREVSAQLFAEARDRRCARFACGCETKREGFGERCEGRAGSVHDF
jgi:hypothetical protein